MPSRRAARCVATILLSGLVASGCNDSDSASSTVAITLAPLVTTTTSAVLPPTTTTTTTTSTTAATTTSTTLPPTTTSTTSTTTSTTLPPTTTTTIVTAGATVIVANATDIPGAAARTGDLLRGWGFTVGDPTNAAGNEEFRETTAIYFLPAGEAVARSVAISLGGDIPVAPMPVPAPIFGATAALGDSTVLLMLGADRAAGA